ncbi:MAG TPA: aldo/keto reductase [Anaerolineales bacterium]|nr:aldo/keto reductase [Anaerolineales bacterium]HMV94915.1 aldo/keto reductase [Anaerolineales bacterium]HMX19215.1 aldo/keto reductase [Anaerolineales bacterium]HMX74845.1 aldo/keto reductase [Anaerolineales bacterium]HMZ44672.1 aldo/keto reductase [Anaerolineales bacterium]
MRYQLLGRSGLRVSEASLGTMTFGETWGWGASKAESKKMFDLFTKAGGNFIDTSFNYTDGTAEEFLGDFLKTDRDYFVLASKYTLTKPDNTDPNGGGNSRKNMMRSVEQSLKRLKTDFLDIYYLHVWDYMTPVDEVVRGLDDLVRQGKVNYVAFSDSPDYIVAEANTRAELMGWSRFIGMQIPYSLLDRAVERSVIPMAAHWEMAVLPWGLLEAGILTGKFLKSIKNSTRLNPKKLRLSEKQLSVVQEVQRISEETGKPMSQVAINWVRQSPKAQMIPILGARTASQLKDNLAAFDWKLDDDQYQRLEKVSAIEMGFPYDFIPGNPYVYGATFDKIDRPIRR